MNMESENKKLLEHEKWEWKDFMYQEIDFYTSGIEVLNNLNCGICVSSLEGDRILFANEEFCTCLKNDADIADAIQDTILSCYENLPQLRQARYFRTWMIRILINKCNDILKKRLSYTDIWSVREEGTKDAGLERSEWKELLNALDEKYSIVLLMHYYEEMTVTEIGRALGVNRNTVLTRLHRGRKLLRNELQPIEKCRSSIFS